MQRIKIMFKFVHGKSYQAFGNNEAYCSSQPAICTSQKELTFEASPMVNYYSIVRNHSFNT